LENHPTYWWSAVFSPIDTQICDMCNMLLIIGKSSYLILLMVNYYSIPKSYLVVGTA
jgi:hypothetical protein